MKTFEEARRELLTWRFSEEDEAEKTPNGTDGYDGLQEARRREIVAEYREKLAALKKKYGIETEVQKKESVGKTRTFGQVIHPPV